MPYQDEFAGYRSLRRITETARVQQLLRRSRIHTASSIARVTPKSASGLVGAPLEFVVAIDGSYAEVNVQNGYPGAMIGYCTVASVLLKLGLIDQLDQQRPIDPQEFRRTEEAATIDAALPGSNVVTHTNQSARDSFREALYEVLHDVIVDEDDRTNLLDTYEALLARKPSTRPQTCPYEYDGCQEHFPVGRGIKNCNCALRRPIYSTDALRIHESFRDTGTNGELLTEVMQVWERILLVHLLRGFEQRGWLDARIKKLAFILDGPLAIFGHPAWLSAAISEELKRLNGIVHKNTGTDLLILGVEKSGTFVTHFDEIDQTEKPGENFFSPASYALLTDIYIKERVIYSDSNKRYGLDTYFGRKFFYKTIGGARIVARGC